MKRLYSTRTHILIKRVIEVHKGGVLLRAYEGREREGREREGVSEQVKEGVGRK